MNVVTVHLHDNANPMTFSCQDNESFTVEVNDGVLYVSNEDDLLFVANPGIWKYVLTSNQEIFSKTESAPIIELSEIRATK